MSIAARIDRLMSESGWTSGQFASACDLDETRLLEALQGERSFSSLDLAKIAESCMQRGRSVTVDWLLDGRERTPAIRACRMPDDTNGQ